MNPSRTSAATFADDLAFLKKHVEVVTLSDRAGKAQVAVVPAWQGRIMTSTATGPEGLSYGWINRELVASGQFLPHINAFGGEDRFWMGPEGGQFSIFFAKGAAFDLEHWQTPPVIDTEPFKVVGQGRDQAAFRRAFELTNYSGTVFKVQVDRQVRLLTPAIAWRALALKPAAGVELVAVESVNKITNKGKNPWTKETGLLSIWILGMFNPSPATTIVVPIKPGPESELGKPVNADYFGRVPPERLVVKDRVAYFSGDGQYPQQDWHQSPARPAGAREFRCGQQRADPGPIHSAGRNDRLCKLDVGDPEGPVLGRRRQQLQRRPARPRQETDGAVLRDRVLLACGCPGAWQVFDPCASHPAFDRPEGRTGCDCEGQAGGRFG